MLLFLIIALVCLSVALASILIERYCVWIPNFPFNAKSILRGCIRPMMPTGAGVESFKEAYEKSLDYYRSRRCMSIPKFNRGDLVQVTSRDSISKGLQGIVVCNFRDGYDIISVSVMTLNGPMIAYKESWLTKIGQVGEEEIKAIGGINA